MHYRIIAIYRDLLIRKLSFNWLARQDNSVVIGLIKKGTVYHVEHHLGC